MDLGALPQLPEPHEIVMLTNVVFGLKGEVLFFQTSGGRRYCIAMDPEGRKRLGSQLLAPSIQRP